MLALFLSISHLDGLIERKILEWELEISTDFDNSFICRINKILQKYQLPKAEKIMKNPPSKYKWKKTAEKAINEYWSSIWTEEYNTKSTLKHLSLQNDPVNNPHNIWKCVRNNQYDIKKAELKCKLVTGNYMLRGTKAKFSRNTVLPYCKLCRDSDETIEHFLLKIISLSDVRQRYMVKLLNKL
ncbi:unnamed protein product [Mytilus coruscus]|uniref:Reverse transcriptase domain-containing protein n=1 Tax=Mytilus coruscus TaxID=42192 RepID=A0A6J8DIN9_MYTCO|nr:unnamed protein product [Mytilus coruscus]